MARALQGILEIDPISKFIAFKLKATQLRNADRSQYTKEMAMRLARSFLTVMLLASAGGSLAQAPSLDSVCARKGIIFIGEQTLCKSVASEVLWKSAADPTRQEVIRLVQFGLMSLGFPPGPLDGIEGTQTRDAIRKFNSARGAAGGAIDDGFLERLFAALQDAGHFRRLEEEIVPPPPVARAPALQQQVSPQSAQPAAKVVTNLAELRSRAAKVGGAAGAVALLAGC